MAIYYPVEGRSRKRRNNSIQSRNKGPKGPEQHTTRGGSPQQPYAKPSMQLIRMEITGIKRTHGSEGSNSNKDTRTHTSEN